jgi:hypothetical protein
MYFNCNSTELFSNELKMEDERGKVSVDIMKKFDVPDSVITHDNFIEPTVKNPFSNPLISEPLNKSPAPPVTNKIVKSKILQKAKKNIQEMNPNIGQIEKKIFTNKKDELEYEQSLRQFYTVPNDQGAFADFLYGSMKSCKSGNMFACAKLLSQQ